MKNPSQHPRVITTSQELRTAIHAARQRGHTIGFVPTMGALHAGHLSLVQAARSEHGCAVVSIFVNPTQFGAGEDFERYPRPFESDMALLAEQHVDVVFAPPTQEVYRPGSGTTVDVGAVAEPLEGQFRPGHFRGVATVVLKLFNIVAPDAAYFGRKDYQQTLVIRRMAGDLDLPVKVVVCPTIRETDGLALSSRNVYLSPREREQALVLSQGLRLARELAAQGERDAKVIAGKLNSLIAAEPDIRVDYIAIVDGQTLRGVERIDRGCVALLAARVGKTRLIDNDPIGEALPTAETGA